MATGISVTMLCPGPTFSNLLAVAATENRGEVKRIGLLHIGIQDTKGQRIIFENFLCMPAFPGLLSICPLLHTAPPIGKVCLFSKCLHTTFTLDIWLVLFVAKKFARVWYGSAKPLGILSL